MEKMARQIHETRIAGLHVDFNETGLQIPTEAIDDKEADDIISLAEARVELCEAENPRLDFSSEELDIQSWLLEKTEDPGSRNLIFSPASMKKMAELKNGLKWVQWLKSVFEEAEAKNLKLVEKEIQRGLQLKEQDNPIVPDRYKWRVRIRLYTQSHSIRPGVLSKWNKASNWIQLIPVSGKKD